jgi:hypothetical protein
VTLNSFPPFLRGAGGINRCLKSQPTTFQTSSKVLLVKASLMIAMKCIGVESLCALAKIHFIAALSNAKNL